MPVPPDFWIVPVLFNVDPVNRSAMLGIVIGEKGRWDQGYGQEAINLLLDYGFSLLNLNSVMLGTFSFNERALHCYEKVGFTTEGILRQEIYRRGQYHDALIMRMLRSEWEELHKREPQ